MAKGDKCIISNCKNIITQGRKGRICGTHRWRKKKFGSYDLPSYKGIPNTLIEEKMPEGFVKKCEIHGFITIQEAYPKSYKQKITSYNCKKCMLSINIKNKYKCLNGLEDYDRMLIEQNNECKMCKNSQNNTTRNGKTKRFNIDHCHKTGKVRGLLCSFCNSLLGYAKDSIETLESAIKYLKENN